MQPFVSVIIPVYNNAERLKICLRSLQKQTYPKEKYEIIVVDNGSNDDIRTAVDGSVILAHESKPSSYAARNKGIKLAKGEILAFTDSDCIPAQDWIEKGVNAVQNTKNCGLIGGNVERFSQKNPTIIERYELAIPISQEYLVKHRRFAMTANMFTRRQVMEKVGHFNSTLKSSGDFEWGQRVSKSGYEMKYAHDARVRHPVRSTFRQLCQREARLAGGKYATRKISQLANLAARINYLCHIISKTGKKYALQMTFLAVLIQLIHVMEYLRIFLGGTPKR